MTSWVTIADSGDAHTRISADEIPQVAPQSEQRRDSANLPDTEEATGSIPVPPTKLKGCEAMCPGPSLNRMTAILTAALTTSNTWSWCSDPKLLDFRPVGEAYLVPAAIAGRNEQCVDFEMYQMTHDGFVGKPRRPLGCVIQVSPSSMTSMRPTHGCSYPRNCSTARISGGS